MRGSILLLLFAIAACGSPRGNDANTDGHPSDDGALGDSSSADTGDGPGPWQPTTTTEITSPTQHSEFGNAVAISSDGSTLVVGAAYEDLVGMDAGGVYVFVRTGASWTQQAHLQASNAAAGDLFGGSISLSDDGATLVVGAGLEDSAATGVDGDQASNGASRSGAAYVFERTGTVWTQTAYLKASNTAADDAFGSCTISGDGTTIAIGATGEDSGSATNPADNSVSYAGAIYVFTRSGGSWAQRAYVKAATPAQGDDLGFGISLSRDGSVLAAGGYCANGCTGKVFVFARTDAQWSQWSQQAVLESSMPAINANFGWSVALSHDATTLAVGAYGQNASDVEGAGAVEVFTRAGTAWTRQATLWTSNRDRGDSFGVSVALSDDGNVIVAGATAEDGNGSAPTDDSVDLAGAAYTFTRTNGTWTEGAYLKAPTPSVWDRFGRGVARSETGVVVIGRIGSDSVDGSPFTPSAVHTFE